MQKRLNSSSIPDHPRENERLVSLCALDLPAQGTLACFNDVARQAAVLCGSSYATVTAIRRDRQSVFGTFGANFGECSREEAICARTILDSAPLIVFDALLDPRFSQLPYVVGDPFIRFYAGVPVLDGRGLPLGSVCVLHSSPRTIGLEQLHGLERLAALTGVLLEARRLLAGVVSPSFHPLGLQAALTRLDAASGVQTRGASSNRT